MSRRFMHEPRLVLDVYQWHLAKPTPDVFHMLCWEPMVNYQS